MLEALSRPRPRGVKSGGGCCVNRPWGRPVCSALLCSSWCSLPTSALRWVKGRHFPSSLGLAPRRLPRGLCLGVDHTSKGASAEAQESSLALAPTAPAWAPAPCAARAPVGSARPGAVRR